MCVSTYACMCVYLSMHACFFLFLSVPVYLRCRVGGGERLGEGGRPEALKERRVHMGRADDRRLDVYVAASPALLSLT